MRRLLIAIACLPLAARLEAQPHVAGCAVFPANNVWNAPVDTLPLDPNSNTYVATIGAGQPAHPDFGSGLWDGGPIGIPFVDAPGTQAEVKVTFEYDDESDHAGYPLPPDVPIEGGPASSGDRHVLVVDHDNCVLYELYSAYHQPDGSWRAGSGAIFDLKSNAMRPAGWTSADAAGLPIFPGLVRYEEVAAGEIRHAIRFTAPRTRQAYIWPARHYASSLTAVNYPPMGQRFRLKAGVDISTFSPPIQIILRALKKYGMILADNGSSWYLSGAPNDRWDNDVLHEITRLQGSDFEAVDESSLMADANSGAIRATNAAPTIAATVNAASFLPGALAPGEIISIFGSGFGQDPAQTKVYFDGIAAPLIYVSASQINAVVPYEVSGKTSTTLSTEVSGARTDPQKLTVEPAAPGIFVVLNQDYSINSAANPAAPNSVIILYATGEGQTDPAGVDGKIATSVWPKPLLAVTLAIGGNPAKVLYAGAAPYLIAGAMQINARLPASSPVGTPLTVRLSVGGYSSQDGVSVMVRK